MSSYSKDNLLEAPFLNVVERRCGGLEGWVVRFFIGQSSQGLENFGRHNLDLHMSNSQKSLLEGLRVYVHKEIKLNERSVGFWGFGVY